MNRSAVGFVAVCNGVIAQNGTWGGAGGGGVKRAVRNLVPKILCGCKQRKLGTFITVFYQSF